MPIYKINEFNTTEEIIQDIAGKMVILLDDEDRENEGDLVCAVELVDVKKSISVSKAKGLVFCPYLLRNVIS